MTDAQYDAALRVWRHHEQRRRDRVPTVSVLLTRDENERSAFEAALADRRFVYSRAADVSSLAFEWLTAVVEECDVLDEAFSFAAQELEEPDLRLAWSTRSDRERRLWLDRCQATAHPQLRAALEMLASALDADDAAGEPLEKLRALLSWLPRREQLVFGVAPAGPAALRALLTLAIQVPHASFVADVKAEIWSSVLEQLDDRSRTALTAAALPTLPRASLETTDSRSQSIDLQLEAARALTRGRSGDARISHEAAELGERARSLAELRLFELLQADSITRGLFELSRRMPFSFGSMLMEVDLACVELRLAIEVDGYHHFRESTAYRRDRRKDVILQHQGYLVSRHLATDVVDRAGEVVRAIRALVLRRRRMLQRESQRR